ncbi:MAG: GNAT family N-acetyltransferase [Candidatus Fimadaptatus sp.]|jgi:ribosomal-protein-alanine N-acetyltransferase
MNTPTLHTERLILRRFAGDDTGALFDILSDEEVNRFLPWFPARSMDDARRFYEERYAAQYALEQAYAYAICLKSDNVPIGYIGIGMDDSHDLGYGLARAHWGMGIAAEAGRAVIEQARRDGLPYLTATHDRNNPASGSVMRKLGMAYRYSYEELWQPKNFPVVFRMYQLNFTADEDYVYRKYWNMYENHFVESI